MSACQAATAYWQYALPVMGHVVKDFHHEDDAGLFSKRTPGKGGEGILLHHSEALLMPAIGCHLLLLHSCQLGADFQRGVACASVHLLIFGLKVILCSARQPIYLPSQQQVRDAGVEGSLLMPV